MKVSVIVPAYNSADFICETLDNLLEQTLKDIEIVVVNDGSTDNTEEIIKQYCQKHGNVVLVNQPNGGVSSARNHGLEVATGEYVCFLDADDIYSKNSLEAFYNRAKEKNADVVIGRLRTFSEEGFGKFNAFGDVLSKMDSIDPFDLQLLWNFLVGNKFYRRDRLVESGVRFPPFRYSEEGAFFMQYVFTKPVITGAYESEFLYRRHSKEQGRSVSQTVSKDLAKSFCDSLDMIYQGALKATEGMEQSKRDEYLGEILYKKAYVLIGQFYRMMWHGDDECVSFCKEQVTQLLSSMPSNRKNAMLVTDCDLHLNNMFATKQQVADSPNISVIYTGKGNAKQFIIDLYDQLSPMFELIIPRSLADSGLIPEEYAENCNIVVLPDRKFVKTAKKKAKGKVMIFRKSTALDLRMIRLVYKLKNKLPEKLVDMFFPFLARLINFVLVKGILK